ncbi:MAG: threonylcarbamoyl-AMP synthase [Bacteroidetes bacterium 4572_112]|nr:MAG: threonylcarbamoyl-AMP synthase [Bacteroidetes bacterium 4572_112]
METEIKNAIAVLKKGGVIVYPTDTIWGIGCDATNAKAIKKIHDIKRRVEEKTMIVLLSDINDIKEYVHDVPDAAYDLIETWQKPLTIVYDGAKNLASNLVRDNDTVAIRISKDEFSNRLIKEYGKPIVSTSANESGKPSPIFYKDIDDYILENADYVVDLFRDTMNDVKPSTIIKMETGGSFKIIRS